MHREPIPREGVFDTYWYFAAERQHILEKRVKGDSGPWTTDRILQEYKFCNTFRAADRVSQFMIRDVACGPADTDEDRVFQVTAFRTFSKPETWGRLEAILGQAPTIEDLKKGAFRKALDSIRAQGHGLYTGAFILCATAAYGFSEKHRNHAALFEDMFVKHDVARKILDAPTFEDIYDLLHSFPLMGDFMSYQTAIDLNYMDALEFSENDFTKPGPGAVRGLQKVFESLGDYSPEQAIMWMVDRQEEEFERLQLEFGGLWGRDLHAIDCQGLFCETDKYSREAFPDLTSARKHIKAKFAPRSDAIPLFFPPKWGINEDVPMWKTTRTPKQAPLAVDA